MGCAQRYPQRYPQVLCHGGSGGRVGGMAASTGIGADDDARGADYQNQQADRSGGVPTGTPELPPPFVRPENVPGLVRAARRLTDHSQRQFAAAAEVSRSTVARVESGQLAPSLAMLRRLLAVAGIVLVATDRHGRVVHPMQVWDQTRDGADRQFPAHLDLIIDPRMGEWWGDIYGLARPPETFHRDRQWRDAKRRRSQWEVRVKQFRGMPEPPCPDRLPGCGK